MDDKLNDLVGYCMDYPEEAAREIARLRKIEEAQHLAEWALNDIKRLVREAERDESGSMPVTRDTGAWPIWIGSAHAHLKMLVERVEQARK